MEDSPEARYQATREITSLGYEMSVLKDSSIGFEQVHSKENKVYHFISRHNLGSFIKRSFDDKVNIYESRLGDRIVWVFREDEYGE